MRMYHGPAFTHTMYMLGSQGYQNLLSLKANVFDTRVRQAHALLRPYRGARHLPHRHWHVSRMLVPLHACANCFCPLPVGGHGSAVPYNSYNGLLAPRPRRAVPGLLMQRLTPSEKDIRVEEYDGKLFIFSDRMPIGLHCRMPCIKPLYTFHWFWLNLRLIPSHVTTVCCALQKQNLL